METKGSADSGMEPKTVKEILRSEAVTLDRKKIKNDLSGKLDRMRKLVNNTNYVHYLAELCAISFTLESKIEAQKDVREYVLLSLTRIFPSEYSDDRPFRGKRFCEELERLLEKAQALIDDIAETYPT